MDEVGRRLPEPVSWANATIPVIAPSGIPALVARGQAAACAWTDLSAPQRAESLMGLRELVSQRAGEIAKTIARGTGKPMSDALLFEVAKVTDTLDACVAFALDDAAARRLTATFASLGLRLMSGAAIPPNAPRAVVCVIAPVGSPFERAFSPAALALTAGRAVIVKSSASVPKVGVLIACLLEEALAEFPGLVQVVHGPHEVSTALMKCKAVEVIVTADHDPEASSGVADCPGASRPPRARPGAHDEPRMKKTWIWSTP